MHQEGKFACDILLSDSHHSHKDMCVISVGFILYTVQCTRIITLHASQNAVLLNLVSAVQILRHSPADISPSAVPPYYSYLNCLFTAA